MKARFLYGYELIACLGWFAMEIAWGVVCLRSEPWSGRGIGSGVVMWVCAFQTGRFAVWGLRWRKIDDAV